MFIIIFIIVFSVAPHDLFIIVFSVVSQENQKKRKRIYSKSYHDAENKALGEGVGENAAKAKDVLYQCIHLEVFLFCFLNVVFACIHLDVFILFSGCS